MKVTCVHVCATVHDTACVGTVQNSKWADINILYVCEAVFKVIGRDSVVPSQLPVEK